MFSCIRQGQALLTFIVVRTCRKTKCVGPLGSAKPVTTKILLCQLLLCWNVLWEPLWC